MKRILFLFVIVNFLVSCDKSGNKSSGNIKDKKWKIDYLFCLDEMRENYTLAIQKDTSWEANYGNFVVFSAKGVFKSYYTAPCGTDCFRTIYGIWNEISDVKFTARVDSVQYSGWCGVSIQDSTWMEYRNGESIHFKILKIDGENIVLKLN